jgi:hypothetical protein
MIRPDDKAACHDSGYDPELWFPDPYHFRNQRSKLFKQATHDVIVALTICSECPLFANGKCLEMAMQDISTIDYGIWAGTFPNERRRAVGSVLDAEIWQDRARHEATKQGLIKPFIAQGERPRSTLWDYLDPKALIGKSVGYSQG